MSSTRTNPENNAVDPRQPVSATRRKPPMSSTTKAWLILTSVLTLALIVSWAVAKMQMKDVRTRYETTIATLQQDLVDQRRQALEAKGMAVGRALQAVNLDLIDKEGNDYAAPYFKELIKDRDIVYIALADKKGTVRAYTNMIFLAENLGNLGDAVKFIKPAKYDLGADVEVAGPIKDINGEPMGWFLVGLQYAMEDTDK